MGLLFSLPLMGPVGTIATSCLGGLAFCFTSTAGMSGDVTYTYSCSQFGTASMFCKSCNCNSSIATRVGFAVSISYCTKSMETYASVPDYIHLELVIGLAHENTIRH